MMYNRNSLCSSYSDAITIGSNVSSNPGSESVHTNGLTIISTSGGSGIEGTLEN